MRAEWTPSEHGSDRRRMQKRVTRGLSWTLLDTWGSQFIGFLTFAILARLLTDVDFGLVALAAVFVTFAQLLIDQGLGDALIQRRVVTRTHIDTAFWAAVLTGMLLTAAGIVLSGPIAALLGQPAVAPIIAVLSFNFIVTALSSVQIALMRRELAFRSLALRRLSALLVGGVVGVAGAFLGYGAWALVAQQIAYGIVSVVALWTVSPWRPGLSVSRSDFRELFGFGVHVVGSDLLGYLSRHSDNLLVGAVLGPGPLGLYFVGYRILETTQTLLISASRKLAFPVLSKLQADPDRLRRAYGRVNRLVGLVVMPSYIGLALVAQEAIVVLFGAKWAESGPVAAVLFLIGPAVTVQALSGALLNAAGHPEITFRFRLMVTVVHVIGFFIGATIFRDIVAVAATYVVGGYLLLPVNLYLVGRYAGIPAAEHLTRLRSIGIATALMAAAVLAVKFGLSGTGPALLLAGEVLAGAVVYIVAIALLERELFQEVVGVGFDTIPGGRRLGRALHLRASPRRKRPNSAGPGQTGIDEELQETMVDPSDIESSTPPRKLMVDPSLGSDMDQ